MPYITLILAWLVQITLSPYLKFNLVHPDLILIVTISWIILRGWDEGLSLALFAGLCLDFTSATPFGVFTVTMFMVALAADLIHDRIFGRTNLAMPAMLILPITILFYAIALTLLRGLGRPLTPEIAFVNIIMPAAFLNTVVMLPIFGCLYLLNRWFRVNNAVTL